MGQESTAQRLGDDDKPTEAGRPGFVEYLLRGRLSAAYLAGALGAGTEEQ